MEITWTSKEVVLIGVLMVLLGVCLGGLTLGSIRETNSYKQGQIDAINGTIKYHLVVQPDSTRVWELK